ncbi:MAG: methylated-DNA--[protein]-cysteine S-methyltransferase [Anaerolineae bacterium]|nr:methylated-DNA--[protein]-cysteine S-methyltransferase [Anaerolineae bacterium]
MDTANYVVFDSPLGAIWLAATERGICALGFGESAGRLAGHLTRHNIATPEPGETPVLREAVSQLKAYFEEGLQTFDVPLDLRGTPFQKAVWEELRHIGYGETLTYGQVALEVERPNGAQAVGRAVGANPVSLIVPCHRVVGQDGDLTGYAYGVGRKGALLELEQHGRQLQIGVGSKE